MKCEICGKEDIKNLGVHKYKMHRETLKPGEVITVTKIELTEIENVPQEKPLNDLILEIKKLIRPYQNQIETKILENGGKIKEIQIIARIQI